MLFSMEACSICLTTEFWSENESMFFHSYVILMNIGLSIYQFLSLSLSLSLAIITEEYIINEDDFYMIE